MLIFFCIDNPLKSPIICFVYLSSAILLLDLRTYLGILCLPSFTVLLNGIHSFIHIARENVLVEIDLILLDISRAVHLRTSLGLYSLVSMTMGL